MRVEQLPFTIYDIIGYLAPGVLWLWAILAVAPMFGIERVEFRDFALITEGTFGKLLAAIIFLIVAFLTGHIINYISSLTIEELAKYFFGFPSFYIVRHYTKEKYGREYSIIDNVKSAREKYSRMFWIVIFVALPISLTVLTLHKTNFIQNSVKALHPRFIEILDKIFPKVVALRSGKGFVIPFEDISDSTKDTDWLRFVAFEVLNNNATAQYRMYNYVTIYGFLRCMCFTSLTASWLVIISIVFFSFSQIIIIFLFCLLWEASYYFLHITNFIEDTQKKRYSLSFRCMNFEIFNSSFLFLNLQNYYSRFLKIPTLNLPKVVLRS